MNKSEIDRILAKRHGLTIKQMDAITDDLFQTIIAGVANAGQVDIHRFGKFAAKTMSARTARNPKTGESIQVGKRTRAHFKGRKAFRDALN